MSRAHLACAADAAYAPHSAATIHSVLANRGPLELTVHLLHGERFPVRRAEAIGAMVVAGGAEFEAHRIPDERVAGLPAWGEVSVPMWFRVFLPELLPDADRVLYLDDDVIALDSLAPLWETELGDSFVAAVTNVFMEHERGRPAALGLSEPYFNSGVLLLNLERMRAEGSTAELLAYGRAEHELDGYPDQDALNVVLGAGRVALHPRWNAMNSVMLFESAAGVFGEQAVAEARERPGLRHFEGPGDNKPWHLLCDRPHREAYLRHRRATPWPRFRPAGITPANLARRVAQAGRRRRSGPERR